MDAIEQRHRLIRLVRLQPADEVQFDIGVRGAQIGPLGLRLLHPVLAEHALAGVNQRQDRLGALGLADRDQGDVGGRAPRGLAHTGDAGADVGEAGGLHFSMERLYSGWVTRAKASPRPVADQRRNAMMPGWSTHCPAVPRGSGFIYRHYHLPDPARFRRFLALRRIARARGHVVILADSALTARE